jgi:4-coumarate--CoA ligase
MFVQLLCPPQGYYNNPEANLDLLDDEGFVKTGDIGYFNEDESLMVTNRKKDVFKWKGYQVNPSEIEELIQSIEGVGQVSVVGIPDQESQNLATAFVVTRTGFTNLTEQKIVDHVARHLSTHKQLHGGVVFIDSLPRTVSGKVKKRLLIENISKTIQK